jgi:hypothetical protein
MDMAVISYCVVLAALLGVLVRHRFTEPTRLLKPLRVRRRL